MNIMKHLIDRYEKQSLGPLYIIRSGYEMNFSEVFFWYESFFNKIGVEKDQCLHHPDIYIINPPKTNSYLFGDPQWKELFERYQREPLYLNYHFTVIESAVSITPSLATKFLKLLEDSPSGHCLFLLTPCHHNLLPTLESRAQTLFISSDKKEEKPQLLSESSKTILKSYLEGKTPLHTFMSYLKDEKKSLLPWLANWESEIEGSYEHKKDWLHLVKRVVLAQEKNEKAHSQELLLLWETVKAYRQNQKTTKN